MLSKILSFVSLVLSVILFIAVIKKEKDFYYFDSFLCELRDQIEQNRKALDEMRDYLDSLGD